MPGLVEKSPLKGTPAVGFTRLFSRSPGIYARAGAVTATGLLFAPAGSPSATAAGRSGTPVEISATTGGAKRRSAGFFASPGDLANPHNALARQHETAESSFAGLSATTRAPSATTGDLIATSREGPATTRKVFATSRAVSATSREASATQENPYATTGEPSSRCKEGSSRCKGPGGSPGAPRSRLFGPGECCREPSGRAGGRGGRAGGGNRRARGAGTWCCGRVS